MAQVRIWVHAVWATKRREPLMTNKNKRIELFKHIKSYAKEKKIYLDFINGESDHVHTLISMACDQNIAQIMKLLKEKVRVLQIRNNCLRQILRGQMTTTLLLLVSRKWKLFEII